MKIVEYVDSQGRNPFSSWYARLDPTAATKVMTSLIRLEDGNHSNVKSVGHGVHECKINFGPGYRIYFGYEGKELIILLAGGSKTRQQNDIAEAHSRWRNYKQRKP